MESILESRKSTHGLGTICHCGILIYLGGLDRHGQTPYTIGCFEAITLSVLKRMQSGRWGFVWFPGVDVLILFRLFRQLSEHPALGKETPA